MDKAMTKIVSGGLWTDFELFVVLPDVFGPVHKQNSPPR